MRKSKFAFQNINQFLHPYNLHSWDRRRFMSDFKHMSALRQFHGPALLSMLIGVSLVGGLQPASAQSASADAVVEIEVPLTISKTADMRFGNIIPGTSASIARMVNNGAITMMGTATHAGGTFGQASFEVTGPPNRWITFNFGAPSILLTNGAGQFMTLERFKPFGYQRISAQGNRQLRASADLLVGANQPPGLYTGEFNVTIDFQ